MPNAESLSFLLIFLPSYLLFFRPCPPELVEGRIPTLPRLSSSKADFQNSHLLSLPYPERRKPNTKSFLLPSTLSSFFQAEKADQYQQTADTDVRPIADEKHGFGASSCGNKTSAAASTAGGIGHGGADGVHGKVVKKNEYRISNKKYRMMKCGIAALSLF